MTDYAAVLREALQGRNEAMQAADSDLHQVILALSKGVEDVSGGKLKVRLYPKDENIHGISYGVVIQSTDRESPAVAELNVPTHGYPIVVVQAGLPVEPGQTSPESANAYSGCTLENKQELETFFADIAKNPDSALVKQIAFKMKQLTSN